MSQEEPLPEVTVVENILTEEEIKSLLNNDIVLYQYEKIQQKDAEPELFYIDLDENIKNKLIEKLKLNQIKNIPMKWKKGDREEHKDFIHYDDSEKPFFTRVFYPSVEKGILVIGDQQYQIKSNTGYIFNGSSVTHKVINSDNTYRLHFGPMDENGNCSMGD